MTDVPPPERPLDDQARSRLRSQILASLGEGPGSARPWLVPIAAAVAMVVIAGATGFVALRSGGSAGPSSGDRSAAGDPSSATSEGAPQTPVSGDPATRYLTCTDEDGNKLFVVFTSDESDWPVKVAGAEQGAVTCESTGGPDCVETAIHDGVVYARACPEGVDASDAGTDGDGDAGETCAGALGHQLEHPAKVQAFPATYGATSFWVAGQRFALCHDSGHIVTVHRAATVDPEAALTTADLRFSSDAISLDAEGVALVMVAGGILPADVEAVSYTFPDAHVQPADIATDADGRRWWRMEYTATQGPLADPQQNRLELAPVSVTISRATGVETVELEFGRDDCAQANHGC